MAPAITDPTMLDTHEKGHVGGTWESYEFPRWLRPRDVKPDLVCCFRVNDRKKPDGGHIVTDLPARLDAWIKKYVMADGTAAHGRHGAARPVEHDEANNPRARGHQRAARRLGRPDAQEADPSGDRELPQAHHLFAVRAQRRRRGGQIIRRVDADHAMLIFGAAVTAVTAAGEVRT